MVFRVNFLSFWVVCNGAYAMIVESYAAKPFDKQKIYFANDGSMGFLEIFALYLAGLVVFRLFFGGIHILRMKYNFNVEIKYKTERYDMMNEVRKLRK